MSVGVLPKPKKVACKRSGKRLVRIRAFGMGMLPKPKKVACKRSGKRIRAFGMGMLPKPKKVACKRPAKRLVRIRAFTAASGAFVFEVYGFQNVVCMRQSYLSEMSDTVEWLDVSMPHKRSHRLKDHKQLKEIAQHNPNNEDIFEDNLIDNFSHQRLQEVDDVCLCDLVANYDWQGRDRQGRRIYKKLPKPKLRNHKLFHPENENQREDYYYSLVLLFSPFRDGSGLLLENETAEAAFYRLISNTSSSYHDKLEAILAAQSNIRQINEARQADGQEEKVRKDDDDPQLIGEAKTVMNDVLDINSSSFSELSLDDRVAMLNGDQRRIFENVKAHLLHQQCHEANKCSCDLKPLCMFISGVGGTGKSFLMETIRALVASILSLIVLCVQLQHKLVWLLLV